MKPTIQTTLFRRTKLHRPPVGKDHLHRQRLLDKLNRGLDRPLTLVSAPAGYGKSTLISSWLDMSDIPGSWLSLDKQDNDLRQFLVGFQAAIEVILPEAGRNFKALVAADNLPPLEELACEVINDLDRIMRDFILVLDDFHAIYETSVQKFISEVLRHPPPTMHLVLICRKDPFLPLSNLRARDQVTEVRTNDLRFTDSEVKAYLNITLGDRVEDITAIELANKTEGWVTALHLVVLASRGKSDSIGALSKLKGTSAYVMDYLITEVLDAQPPAIQHLLLSTSILDRFTASLCDAVREPVSGQGESKIDGANFIAKLKNENLFLIALDDEGHWFRYHQLFQDLLRNQLNRRFNSEEIATLHRRASEWYGGESLFEEAFQHVFATGDMELAAGVVERHAETIMNEVKMFVLERWITLLPHDLVQERPKLLWAAAWRHYYQLDLGALPALIDRIEDLIGGDAETNALSKDVAMFRGLCALVKNGGARALYFSEQALDQAGSAQHRYSRSLSEHIFALAGQMEGQRERVTNALTEWLVDPTQRDPLKDIQRLHALTTVSYIAADPGGVGEFLQRGREIARLQGLEYQLAWTEYFDGIFHLQRGALAVALRLLEEAGQRKYFNNVRGAVDGMCAQVLAYQAQDKPEQAAAALQTLNQFIRDTKSIFGPLSEACAIRLAIMQGQSEAAALWLENTAPPRAEVMLFWFEIPCVTWCRALIAEGSDASLKDAEARLRKHAEVNETHHNTLHLIEVLSLLALACNKQGKHDQAFTVLERALTLAWPSGFIFPFLEIGTQIAFLLKRLSEKKVASDLVKKILSTATPKVTPPSKPAPQPLIEPLSNRELEILDLLTQRLQTKEIAGELCISPNTVRTHLQNIYQKLCVGGRRQAVARAIDLGILPNR